MKKKEKLNRDDFDLDYGLITPDFNLDDIEAQANPDLKDKKSRSPVMDAFKGTISGAKDTITSPSFITQTIKQSLPKTYGEITTGVNEFAGGISSLYDDAVKELKPQLSRIAKKIDKLVPEESKRLKKITSTISSFAGNESDLKNNQANYEEQAIANSIAAVFQQQQENEQQTEARENVKTQIRDQVDKKRFESNYGILSSISENISRLTRYNDGINQAFQKKSLELQYRQYFTQAELLKTTKEYSEIFKTQNDAISRNTALPEFVKIHNSEKFKEIARNKFIDSIQNSFFGSESVIGKGMKRLKKDAMDYVGGIKNQLEMASMGLDGLEILQENNRQMAEMGIETDSAAKMAGMAAGGMAVNYAKDKFTDKVKPFLDKNPEIGEALAKGATYVKNIPGSISDLRNNENYKTLLEQDDPQGKAVQFLDKFLNYFTEKSPDMETSSLGTINDLNNASVFNNRTQRSIVEVIPGYLSRIFREITMLRTGEEAPLTYFDFNKGEFSAKGKISSSIDSHIKETIKKSSHGYYLQKVLDDLFEGENITDEDRQQFMQFFSSMTLMKNNNYRPEKMKQSEAYNKLSPDQQKLLDSKLDAKITSSETPEQGQYELTSKLTEAKKAVPDFRGDIEALVQAGYGDILEEKGLGKRNANGTFTIDEDAYYELIKKEGLVTSDINKKQGIKGFSPKDLLDRIQGKVKSDINVKQGISKFSPQNALKAVKNTKIYNWMYKLGQGDQKQHTGPMAQDVNKNMGEEAAPDGTSIDLTTMNGINMSAIQALENKVKDLLGSKDNNQLLKAIKSDTGKIAQSFNQKSKGRRYQKGYVQGPQSGIRLSDGSDYKDIAGNLVGSTFALLQKAGGDLFSAGSSALTFGKDKIAKPVLNLITGAYDKNKDKMKETFSSLFTKASEMAGNVFDFAGKVVNEKLPAGFKQAKEWAIKGKDKFLELIDYAKDMYVDGIESPVLKAQLLRMGYYYDQASGTVIKSFKDIKGPVVNKLGEVVLTAEDLANGLKDAEGNLIELPFSKVAKGMFNLAMKGAARLKQGVKSAFSFMSGKGQGLKGWFKDIKGFKFDDFSFGMGSEKIYNVLVEIRDTLQDKGQPAFKTRAKALREKNAPGKKSLKSINKPEAPETPEAPNAPEAQYQSGGNIIDTIFNKGKSYLTGEKAQSYKDKFNLFKANAAERFQEGKKKGFGNQAKGLWGSIKNAAMDHAAKYTPIMTDLVDKTKAKKESAKDSIIAARDKVVGKIVDKDEKKEDTEEKPKSKLNWAGPKIFNDTDGDGRRQGSWQDKLDQEEKAEKERAAQKKGEVDLKARYKSEENVIDTITGKIGSLVGMLQTGVGGLFGGAGSILESVGSMVGMGGKGGVLSKLLGGVFNVAKLPFKALGMGGKGTIAAARAVGGPLASLASKAGSLPGIANVVSKLGMVRNLGLAASVLSSGTLGAVGGAIGAGLTALGAILSSPVVLGAAAIAATGYGVYKAYKYVTRNDTDMFSDIRIKQYGFGHNDNVKRYNSKMLQLEAYLCDKKIGYRNGQAYILEKGVDKEELLSIFDIDKEDTEQINKFGRWFHNRFKPFFLTHLTALFSINNKAKLSDINSFKVEEKLKFLSLISFESGPYEEDESPFKDVDYANVDKTVALNTIKQATTKLNEQLSKDKDKVKLETVDKPKVATPPEVPKDTTKATTPQPQPYKTTAPSINLGEEGKQKPVTPEDEGKISSGKVPLAAGGPKDGQAGMQYLKLQKGVSLDGLNPELMKNLLGMAQEYGEMTGKSITMTSGVRNRAQQEALYRQDPTKAAKPGSSLHEYGLALDADSAALNELDKLGLMRKYGFTRPVGGETWHFEPAGIQTNIARAKDDPSLASQQIAASLFKGGGGIGADPSSPKGKRNTQYALSLLDQSASQTVSSINKAQDASKTVQKTAEDVSKSGTNKVASADQKAANDPNKDVRIASVQNTIDQKAVPVPNLEGEKKPSPGYGQSDQVKGSGGVKTVIEDAARKTGVDPNLMTTFAAIESSLNPDARAKGSSAKGLYGFIDGTWKEKVSQYGSKYGIDQSASATDPKASSLIAAEYIKENQKALQSVKPNPNATDIYMAHFLGTGGAKKFLSADQNAIGAEVLPKAANSNKSIFYDGSRPLTMSEIYNKVASKINKVTKQFGISLPEGSMPKPQITQSSTQAGNSTRTPTVQAANDPYSKTSIPDKSTGNQPTSDKPKVFSSGYQSVVDSASQPERQKDMSAESLSQVNSTLDKQLKVQTDMLEVLKQILNQNNSRSDIQSQKDNPPSKRSSPSDRSSEIIPGVDLKRKMI